MNKKVSDYLVDLLYRHDCVVIAGFGGFLTQYESAFIHPTLNTISPPKKTIVFNKQLQQEDGLLIQTIAQKEFCSFENASLILKDWIADLKQKLHSEEEVVLEKIGKLYFDIERNLIFSESNTENFLGNSFGLPTITAIPIIHAKTTKQITPPVKSIENTTQTRKSYFPIWKIAASVLCILGLFAILKFSNFNFSKTTQDASLVTFTEKVVQPITPEKPTQNIENKEIQENISDNKNQLLEVKKDSIVEVNTPINPTPSNETKTESSILQNSKYIVIIGAFEKPKNIRRAINSLQQKSLIVFQKKRGRLTLIGFQAGNNFAKATELLSNSQAENKENWLLTN